MKVRIVATSLVALVALSVPTIARSHCGGHTGPRAHDQFGSCESDAGDVSCAADSTDVAGLARLATPGSGSGAQICNEDSAVPVYGRAGVWTGGGRVVVGVDADKDMAPTNGWTRIDAGDDLCVRARRGSTNGSYYTSGGGTSEADALDRQFCV